MKDEPWSPVHTASRGSIEREFVATFGGFNCAVVKFSDEARWPIGWRWYVMLRDDAMHPRLEGVEDSQESAIAMAECVSRWAAFAMQPHKGRRRVNLIGTVSSERKLRNNER